MIKGVIINKPYHKNRVYINGRQISWKKSMEYIQSSYRFNWGYGGAGPTQLVFALLLEMTHSEEIAYRLWDSFKWEFVAKLPCQENFAVSEEVAWKAIKKCARKPNAYIDYIPHPERYPLKSKFKH